MLEIHFSGLLKLLSPKKERDSIYGRFKDENDKLNR